MAGGHGQHATGRHTGWLERHRLTGGMARMGRPSRGRIPAVALLVGVLMCVMLGSASSAQAAPTFYWYGENGRPCWQVGQPGAQATQCDGTNGIEGWFLNSSNPV